jgi:hypothetical protein
MTGENQVKGQRLKVKGTAGCSSHSGVYFSLFPFGFNLGFQP